jgi:hypothetical protein
MNDLGMDGDAWMRTCAQVRDAMEGFVYPLTTPIAFAPPGTTFANLEGTGNYLVLNHSCYVLTNDHVVAAGPDGIAHLPSPEAEYQAVIGRWKREPWPKDLALGRVANPSANRLENSLLPHEFDLAFAPVEHELLFWIGVPGTKAKRQDPITEASIVRNWFGGPLESRAVSMTTQYLPLNSPTLRRFSSEHHVAIPYPTLAWRSAGEPSSELPSPKGMSGSLLWDTKFLSSHLRGVPWEPSLARVCGVLWAAHSKPEVVVAIRVEHVRIFDTALHSSGTGL